MARAPRFTRKVKFFKADVTTVEKTTGNVSRETIVTIVNTDKARNKVLDEQGKQLCYTHSVTEEKGLYAISLAEFLKCAKKIDESEETENTEQN